MGVLFAQSAELSGLVRDPSGASIAEARLELRNLDNGVRFRVSTNQAGLYNFSNLKPGTYDATVQADGFRTLTRSAIILNVGDRAGLDFSLQLGSMASSITVAAEAPMALKSVDGAASTVVYQEFVANMPLNGRSFQSLIHATPGVAIAPSYQDAPGQFSVNGQRTNTNYFTVDGVSANFGATTAVKLGQTISGSTPGLNILGGTNSLVSVEAMQEFRIQTSSYSPEYGRTPGAQVSIVTKSGTNELHGTAYNCFRNDIFDARNWFNMVPQPKPPLRQNNFGGTLGGPIRENRTFFFVSYEGLRLRQPGTGKGNFLTAAARAKAPAVYQPFVNAYPLPTGPVNSDGITAPLTGSYSDASRFDAASFRVDYAAGNRVTLFARYHHAPSTQGGRFFAQFEDYVANTDTATAGATFVISSSKVNDFRANWSRWNGKAVVTMQSVFGAVAPPEPALFPPFSSPQSDLASFSMPFTSGGVGEGTRTSNVQRQLNFVDTFSMTADRHQLKFGVDFRRMEPTNSAINYGYGIFPSNYDTLLAGKTNVVVIFTSDPITARLDSYSLFAQDTWKAAERLTLTYGVRWEVNTPPLSTTRGKPLYSVAGIFDSRPVGLAVDPQWNTRFHNFAPRIGAAWRLGRDTTLRGGFGLFYDLGCGAGTPMASDLPYNRITSTFNNPAIPFDLSSPAFQPLPFTTAIPPNAFVVAVDPHLDLPVTWQWNAAWERSFGSNQALTATYAGAWGRNLLRQDLVVPPGSILATRGGSAGVTYNADYSHYEALQLGFLRRMSRGLQALVSYTLARSTDTGSTDLGLGSTAHYTQSLAGSVPELPLPPPGPSDFDTRHALSVAISWELPASGKAGRWLLKDWALDGMVRTNSAQPLNVLYQRPFSGGYYNVQPDVVPGQPLWISDASQPRGRVVNPKAFAKPAAANGDFPRNSLRGFPLAQLDVALRRRFNLTEGLKLDARVEYFNVFNHPMFASPESLWAYGGSAPLPSFGKVYPGNTLNIGLGGGGLFGGQAAIYAPGGPRSAQFTLKLSF
jgi:hypothetical protein